MWELSNKDDPIEKKETRAAWLANRLFHGTCTISIVNVLMTECYTKIGVKVEEILVKEFNGYPRNI